MLCPFLVLLLGASLGARAQTIHQRPASKVQPVGSSLSLECTLKGKASPDLYWYRQVAGSGLQLLFYSVSIDEVLPALPGNFSASRPEDGEFILSSEKMLLGDSGFCFCAWSPTMCWAGETSVQKPQLPSLRDWAEAVCDWDSSCRPRQSCPRNFRKSFTKACVCVKPVGRLCILQCCKCGGLVPGHHVPFHEVCYYCLIPC